MKQTKIISTLRLIAEDLSPVRSARIVAGIVYKNTLVSIGMCQYRSHPFQKKYGRNSSSIYLHAEIDAILKAKRKNIPLDKSEIYIVRVKRPNSFSDSFIYGLAKPCEGCARALEIEKFKHIYYTENE